MSDNPLQTKPLPSITSVPCTCVCGWRGTIWDCEPDVDGDGSLGCPECLKVVTVQMADTRAGMIVASDKPADINYYGFGIELTLDGNGLIVTAPDGKQIDLTDGRFVVDKKRVEVRVK